MIDKIIRILITIVGTLFGYALGTFIFILAASTYDGGPVDTTAKVVVPLCFAAAGFILAYFTAPGVNSNLQQMGTQIEQKIENVSALEVVGGVLGLIVGLAIAYFISGLYSSITVLHLDIVLSILTFILLGSISATVGHAIVRTKIKSRDDRNSNLRPFFWGRDSKDEKDNKQAKPKIFDTSVIIDGRILGVMKTGILEGKIIIPEYVLTELRHLSDSADPLKKAKGRRGLEIIKEIQMIYGIEIYNTYSDNDWDGVGEVDVKLLRLANKIGGKIVTTDYNLIQVAEIQEIPVLNVNDVVKALRKVLIPGEVLTLQVIKEGRENNQGVGYLDDGTMIVIEGGRDLIGQMITAEVTSVLQTLSGRMIFARPKNHNGHNGHVSK